MESTNNKKVYWKGLEQLSNHPDFVKDAEKEFHQKLPIQDAYGDNTEEAADGNRRDFLKLMGFSVAAVSLAACEAPVKKAIPYLNKPEDVDPGVANYYASTFFDGSEALPVVVKTREGRPIMVEGNKFSALTKGAISSAASASVYALYDNEKAKNPLKGGANTTWEEIDKEIASKLASLASSGKTIAIVSNSIVSPSTKRVIKKFQEKYSTVKHVTYDALSASGIMASHKSQFGKAVVPSYAFEKANVIVSFGADFLGTWVSPSEFSVKYAENRKVGKNDKNMSTHFQFESIMSLTGANADYRTPIKASQEGLAVAALYNEVASAVGGSSISAPKASFNNIKKAAKLLVANKGKSLVVSGSNDEAVQGLVNGINQMLGNYGATLDINVPTYQKQGDDAAMDAFVKDLSAGSIGGVIFYNANPVYNHPQGAKIASAISKASLSISTSDRPDETGALCTYLCPDSHYLESWNDAETTKGHFSLAQPTISTIFSTRQVQSSLLKWAGSEEEYFDILKEYWLTTLMPLQSKESDAEMFWQRCLHDGVLSVSTSAYTSVHAGGGMTVSAPVQLEEGEEVESAEVVEEVVEEEEEVETTSGVDVSSYASKVASSYKAESGEIELVVFANSIMGTGSQANNPILQEVPEPISRVCWGNYVAIPTDMAKELGVEVFENKSSVLKVTANGKEVSLPVVVQPGQASKTIAIPMGYGRGEDEAGKVAAEAGGVSAISLLTTSATSSVVSGVSVSNTGSEEFMAQTQTHHTIMGRETIIQETTLSEYRKDDTAGSYKPQIASYEGKKNPTDISMWDIDKDGWEDKNLGEGKEKKDMLWNERLGYKADVHAYNNHHWGMSIDLNSCFGCGACVVACHVENNVPVVGKQEVVNRREMHWLRIDRYYSSTEGATSYAQLEEAAENPEVVFQPMMCQHCNNAPCETVCPVAATTHSSEGLNQMTYNRCIGTKYCANNCPYKVRRFNWFKYHNNDEFDYHMNNDLGKMVLNPDVTVRSRGVMEKCSLCVQRIQDAKLTAKREGRRPVDGEATTACASACSSGAIKFGDMNDWDSAIRQELEQEIDGRAYNVLDEINVRSNVYYLTKVRNKDNEQA